MGNKCCSQKQTMKDRNETSNPALETIREAQRKYFNSHIESDVDDSDDDDKEDSTDGLYGSDTSLVNCDDEAFEPPNWEEPALLESTTDIKSAVITDSGIDGKTPMGNGNVNNNTIASEDNNTADNTTATAKTGAEQQTEENSTKTQKSKPAVVRRRDKAKYIRLSKRGNFFSIFNTEDKKARSVDPKMYQYPFENLVFEGGGNKGLAYCGAVRLLEELNIWPQIKRLAGTSAGAMTATLLAVGYDSHDLEQFFSLNLNKIFLDHKFGYFSLLPNLLTSYGWNPGKRIYKWFGQKIYEKTGNVDTTFREVYEMYGRELCVVATNLNQMTSLYCHPKTTPDMPVRLAVRMSMCIPGMFQAVKHTLHGQTDTFVDGGVLCNYPIHCFDGWWLSMKPEDNFLEKLQPLEDIPRLLERTERFGIYNEKTLGMQLYSDNEQDLLKYQLENLRHGVQLQELPNTKLAREKIRKKKLQLKTDREHRRLVKAMNSFLRALNKHNADRNDTIDREELEAALNDEVAFPRKRRLILFGDVGSDVILDYLDRDHNGQISYNELLSFMEETGISMQNRFLGYQRREIKNFSSFLETLQATLLTNVKRVYVEERDLKRTVGINTGHVGTSDFVLEPPDIEFVLERGRRSLEAFLKYYVAAHHLKKKPEFKRSYDDLRKDSKASILSSASNQSLGSSGNTAPLAVITQAVLNDYLPFPSEETEETESSQVSQDELPHPSHATHNEVCRTKSGSSTKSVSISDKVDVIGNAKRHNSNSDENITEESYENEDEDEDLEIAEGISECMFLLADQDGCPEVNPTKKDTALHVTKGHGTSSAYCSQTSYPNEQVSPKTPKEGHYIKNPKIVNKSSLKVDVLVHQTPHKPDSPKTPLLQATDSEVLFELHPLDRKQ